MQFPNTMKHNSLYNSNRLRGWATPFTIGAYILTALTGILLFFKINIGLIKPTHEWLSWLLIVGTACHIALNWRPLVRSLSQPTGKIIFFVFILISCVVLLPLGGGTKRRNPAFSIAEALMQAPLSVVAQVAQHSPEETAAMLTGAGIGLVGREQTIQEIADKNGQRAMEVLALVFTK